MKSPDAGADETRAYGLVAIAASAGGLGALATVLGSVPSTFPLPIVVVQHMDPHHQSVIADILGRRTKLKVREARDGDSLAAGYVFVAPPGVHLIVSSDRILHLTHSAPVHYVRPAADMLFESAARSCGPVIAVVLTGTGSDGAAGAATVHDCGGIVIAQDEATSAFFGMPEAAIATGVVDYVLPVGEVGAALIDLAGGRLA